MGLGRDTADWDTTNESDVQDIVRSGLRSFYYPVVDGKLFVWSFLRKRGALTTVSGTYRYSAPADFGNTVASVYSVADGTLSPLSRIGALDVLSLLGCNYASGSPAYYARESTEFLLYPVPDAVYSLEYVYSVEPIIDEAAPLPGGTVHAETILKAVLAAGERTLRPEEAPGIHAKDFERLLAASVLADLEAQ